MIGLNTLSEKLIKRDLGMKVNSKTTLFYKCSFRSDHIFNDILKDDYKDFCSLSLPLIDEENLIPT